MRVVAELRRRGSGLAAQLEEQLGDTAAPRGMAVDKVPVPRTDRPLRIGIIGGGRIGARLATLWARAGHDVRIGVRRPWRVSVEPPVAVGDVSRALSHGQVIVLATPFSALESLAESARQALAGVIVIDVTNPDRLSGPPRSGPGRLGTGVLTGRLFQGARMVKAFNTLADPAFADMPEALVPPAVPIASDDPEAAAMAAQLARDAGFAPVVAGPLSASARFDRETPLWDTLASHSQACEVLGIEAPAQPSHEQVPIGTLVETVLSRAPSRAELGPDAEETYGFGPLGDDWRRQLSEWRLPCPEGLVALADGAADALIDCGGWQLCAPEAAAREWLQSQSELEHLGEMAPLFGRDGDMLLLDAKGRIHLWLHDEWDEGIRVVARDFRALLAIFVAGIDPALL